MSDLEDDIDDQLLELAGATEKKKRRRQPSGGNGPSKKRRAEYVVLSLDSFLVLRYQLWGSGVQSFQKLIDWRDFCLIEILLRWTLSCL